MSSPIGGTGSIHTASNYASRNNSQVSIRPVSSDQRPQSTNSNGRFANLFSWKTRSTEQERLIDDQSSGQIEISIPKSNPFQNFRNRLARVFKSDNSYTQIQELDAQEISDRTSSDDTSAVFSPEARNAALSDCVATAIKRHQGDILLHRGRMEKVRLFFQDIAPVLVGNDRSLGKSALRWPELLTQFINQIDHIPSGHNASTPGQAREDMQLNAIAVTHKAFEMIDRRRIYIVKSKDENKRHPSNISFIWNDRSHRRVLNDASRSVLAMAAANLCLRNVKNQNWTTPHAQNSLEEFKFGAFEEFKFGAFKGGYVSLGTMARGEYHAARATNPYSPRQDKTLNHAVDLLRKVIKSFDKPSDSKPEGSLSEELIQKCDELLKELPAVSRTRLKLYDTLAARIGPDNTLTAERIPAVRSETS